MMQMHGMAEAVRKRPSRVEGTDPHDPEACRAGHTTTGVEMPTYEYQCTKCGVRFERFHGMTAEPVTVCPDCGGEVRRLIGTGAGIIFKGPGFHATDYASKGSGKDRPSCCGSGSCSCDKD